MAIAKWPRQKEKHYNNENEMKLNCYYYRAGGWRLAIICDDVCVWCMYDVSHFTHRRVWKMKPYFRRFFELLKENFIIRNPITKRAL